VSETEHRPAGRLWAGLEILDRQIRDRDGQPCGTVDDAELEFDPETGHVHLVAVLTGPGHLLTRLGSKRLGPWLTRHFRPERSRVPIERVEINGATIDIAFDRDELANNDLERWSRDHLIGHIKGHAWSD